jgi:hypothetical protein
MIRTIFLIVAFGLTAIAPASVLAQTSSSSSIVGAWKVIAVETRELISGKVVRAVWRSTVRHIRFYARRSNGRHAVRSESQSTGKREPNRS